MMGGQLYDGVAAQVQRPFEAFSGHHSLSVPDTVTLKGKVV